MINESFNVYVTDIFVLINESFNVYVTNMFVFRFCIFMFVFHF
jgi:hypothetical protein